MAAVLYAFGCGGEPGNRQPGRDSSTDSAKAGPTTSEQVQPSALPPALRATCDSAAVIAREALNLDLTREDGRYADSFQGTPRLGCRMTGRGSFAALGTSGPVEALDAAFTTKGWTPDLEHSADGPDGSAMGFRRRDMLCLVMGRWSGHDDEDTVARPPREEEDRYELIVECARDAANPLEEALLEQRQLVATRGGGSHTCPAAPPRFNGPAPDSAMWPVPSPRRPASVLSPDPMTRKRPPPGVRPDRSAASAVRSPWPSRQWPARP